jgi:polyhydroxybutyrate depolymerase
MRAAAAALLLALACGRGLPPPDGEEQVALDAAAALAPEPSAGCRSGTLPADRDERETVAVAGEERGWIVDAPAGPADRPLPLVLAFHGFRGSAWRFRWWDGLGEVARREGFVAVHPEGHEGVRLLGTSGRGWDVAPEQERDVDFVRALLDRLEAERCIDRRRVFATGMSNGGFFANLLGCRLAERLAAIAPVSGALELRRCAPSRPIPVMLLYGRADRVVRADLVEGARDWWARVSECSPPVARDGCDHYRTCRADVVWCEGTQAHVWPRDATERIWRFFAAHPRP